MIMVGKVVVSLIWAFWMMAMSTAEGNPTDQTEPVVVIIEEYSPTYSSTFDRVKKRGHVICGTNDEFPGFSQETWHLEDGDRWYGFDVDICRAVAAAMFFAAVPVTLKHILAPSICFADDTPRVFLTMKPCPS